MDQEERTRRILELGHFVKIDINFWLGAVLVNPADLGVDAQMLPIGRQSMQVMSKPWVKKVTLLRESIKRSAGFKNSYLFKFEGGKRRFVLNSTSKLISDNLDVQADKAKKFYKEVTDNEVEAKRIARQVISKNADHLWKTVSHLFPKRKNETKAPDNWKMAMLEAVMEKRFPAASQIATSGLSYSFYKEETLPIIGRHQKPHPGLLLDCGLLYRDLLNMPEKLQERLQRRIPVILKDYPAGGPHALSIIRVQQDLQLYETLNPIAITGHGMEEAWADVQGYLSSVDQIRYRRDRVYRAELAKKLLTLCRLLESPWAEERRVFYTDLFSGG